MIKHRRTIKPRQRGSRAGLVSLLSLMLLFMLAGCSQQNSHTAQGYVEGQFIMVSSAVPGTLKKLDVSRGDWVKPGELLYELDPNPEQAELAIAQAHLQQAEETLVNLEQGQRSTVLEGIQAQLAAVMIHVQLAKKTLERNQHLVKTDAASRAALDSAKADYENLSQQEQKLRADLAEAKQGARTHFILSQKAAVDAALATVKRGKWALQQKTVHAETAARVYDTYFKASEFVPAGQSVLALLPPQNKKIIFYLAEPDAHSVQLGQKIEFQCDGCATRLPAVILFISDQAEYTPPVLYSRQVVHNLVYRIEAGMATQEALAVHPGQPVQIHYGNSK